MLIIFRWNFQCFRVMKRMMLVLAVKFSRMAMLLQNAWYAGDQRHHPIFQPLPSVRRIQAMDLVKKPKSISNFGKFMVICHVRFKHFRIYMLSTGHTSQKSVNKNCGTSNSTIFWNQASQKCLQWLVDRSFRFMNACQVVRSSCRCVLKLLMWMM